MHPFMTNAALTRRSWEEVFTSVEQDETGVRDQAAFTNTGIRIQQHTGRSSRAALEILHS